ncbi:hypothetical protein FJZ26_00600 [Candidatus Parvarchaeota archaeon]|nr:hypothetical protein [Candidatus Parvarchaeota archaeon]
MIAISGDGVLVMLCFEPNQKETSFVANAIKSLEDKGHKFNGRLMSYKSGQLEEKCSVEQAIEVISSEGGIAEFDSKGMWFELQIMPKTFEKKIWEIRLVALNSFFDPNRSQGLNKNDPKEKCIERSNNFIDIAKTVWNAPGMIPNYGIGWHWYSRSEVVPDDKIIESMEYPNSWWINFYGEKLVDKFGAERLKIYETSKGKWPMYRVEKLRNGVLTLNGPTPFVPLYHETPVRELNEIIEAWKIEEIVEKYIEDACEQLVNKGTIKKYWDVSFNRFWYENIRPWYCLAYSDGKTNRYAEARVQVFEFKDIDGDKIKAAAIKLIREQIKRNVDRLKL